MRKFIIISMVLLFAGCAKEDTESCYLCNLMMPDADLVYEMCDKSEEWIRDYEERLTKVSNVGISLDSLNQIYNVPYGTLDSVEAQNLGLIYWSKCNCEKIEYK